jgi:hypothetical protein
MTATVKYPNITIPMDGRDVIVPAADLPTLVSDHGIPQADIIARCATRGYSISQPSVARMMRGQQPINPTLARVLGDLLSGTTTAPRDDGDVDDADVVQSAIVQRFPDFPITEALKVARMARQADKSGKLPISFGTRALELWMLAFHILRDALAIDADEALGMGFYMAKASKYVGEPRNFLTGAFQSVMQFDAVLPHVKTSGTMHPLSPILEACIACDAPVYNVGPTGCGKSWTTRDVLKRTGRYDAAYRFQGDIDVAREDIVGGKGLEADGIGGTSTIYEMGLFGDAMAGGFPIVWDEVDFTDSGIVMVAQAILEGEALVLSRATGKGQAKTVTPTTGFTVICNGNTRGLREDPKYAGANLLSESFRDRFLFLEFDYLSAVKEKRILRDILARVQTTAATIAKGEK